MTRARRNVHVVGLDDFHRDLLETIEDAEEFDFRALLAPTKSPTASRVPWSNCSN